MLAFPADKRSDDRFSKNQHVGAHRMFVTRMIQNWALALVLLYMAHTCPMQAASYTATSPLILGMETNPVLGGNTRTYTAMVVQMMGNFNIAGNNANAGWRPAPASTETGSPYMNGNSIFSSQPMNVLDYAYGDGGFTGNPGSPAWTPATTSFWGTSSGGSSNFYFQQNSGSNQADMKVEVSLFAGITSLAWFDYLNPNVLNNIFIGSDGVGASATFTPTSQWALAFVIGNVTYRTSNNAVIAGFAALQGPPDPGPGGVPEPGTFLTMVIGLIAIGKLCHRQLGQHQNS